MQEVAEWRDLTPEQELAVESAWNELALELKSKKRVSRVRELRTHYKALPEPPTYELDEQGRILSKEATPKPVRQPIQKPQVKLPKAPTLQEARKPLEKPEEASKPLPSQEESRAPPEPEARKGPPKQANQASTHDIISRINDPEELEQRISALESQRANLNPEHLAQLEATQQALRYRKDEIETGYHHGEFGKVKDTLDRLEQENPYSPEYQKALEKHNKYAEAFNKLSVLKKTEYHPLGQVAKQIAKMDLGDDFYENYLVDVLGASQADIEATKAYPEWKEIIRNKMGARLREAEEEIRELRNDYKRNSPDSRRNLAEVKNKRRVIKSAMAAHDKAKSLAHQNVFKLIQKKGPDFKVIPQKGITPEHQALSNEAIGFLNRFASSENHRGGLPFVRIGSVPPEDNQRSHYTTRDGAKLSTKDNIPETVHEICHEIEEQNPRIKEANQELLKLIYGNEPLQSMKTLFPDRDYRENEYGRLDDMEKLFGRKKGFYFGKTYDDGCTEVLSLLGEKFCEDPVEFAIQRPDLLNYFLPLISDPEHFAPIKLRTPPRQQPDAGKTRSLRSKYRGDV